MLITIGVVNGVSTTSLSKAVANVTHCIALLKDHFKIFPQSNEEINTVEKRISELRNILKLLQLLFTPISNLYLHGVAMLKFIEIFIYVFKRLDSLWRKLKNNKCCCSLA